MISYEECLEQCPCFFKNTISNEEQAEDNFNLFARNNRASLTQSTGRGEEELLLDSNSSPDKKSDKSLDFLNAGGVGRGEAQYFVKRSLIERRDGSHPRGFLMVRKDGSHPRG